MKTALELICEFEGFRDTAYRCPAGVLTIGYGRTEGVSEGDVTTKEAEQKYLLEETEKIKQQINSLVKVDLKPNQLEALTSFVYNIGIGAFKQSTMLKFINQGKPQFASTQFPLWKRGGGMILEGLVKRRKAERAVFDA